MAKLSLTSGWVSPDSDKVYQFSPHLVVESFGDEALVLLADQDRFVTINRAALDLMERLRSAFEGRGFSVSELAIFLAEHYELGPVQCAHEAGSLLAAWSEQGILTVLTGTLPMHGEHKEGIDERIGADNYSGDKATCEFEPGAERRGG